MEQKINEIEINGMKYVPKDSAQVLDMASANGLPYVVVRGVGAGVHAGYLKSRDGQEVILVNSRRLWYWDGACSLSQIATDGVSKPSNCKFSVVVPEIAVLGVVEVILTTEKARKNLEGVTVWKS